MGINFLAHDAVVTATIFAPYPSAVLEDPKDDDTSASASSAVDSKENLQKPFEVLVAADWQGGIKLYINR